MEFLDKQHFIQISIRALKNHSTDSSLSCLADKISKGFESGLLAGMILIDLQKAFNTIDHNILKISLLGFSREVID